MTSTIEPVPVFNNPAVTILETALVLIKLVLYFVVVVFCC